MKRITKKERNENARNFYQVFNNYETNRACIVVERNNTGRVQFLAVIGSLADCPVVIAEAVYQGVDGCWKEFIESVWGVPKQTLSYYDDNFKDWIIGHLGFAITYYDGFVFIIERSADL